MIAGDAEKLPAEHGLGGHRAAGRFQRPIGGQAAAGARRHGLQVANDALPRRLGHGDARRLGALQGHELPAELAGVARFVGLVAPAAAVRVLGGDRVIDGPAERLLQPPFAGHAVGLAQGEGGDRMAVHGGIAVGRAGETAFGILRLQEEVQAAADIFLIIAAEVRIAGASMANRARPVMPVSASAPALGRLWPSGGRSRGRPRAAGLPSGRLRFDARPAI